MVIQKFRGKIGSIIIENETLYHKIMDIIEIFPEFKDNDDFVILMIKKIENNMKKDKIIEEIKYLKENLNLEKTDLILELYHLED